ncbi:MAG TPA: TetR family transcriptional regulator [Trebonia sp.]|nr:TetR family transcriptional regulator [Trebonia sp.]
MQQMSGPVPAAAAEPQRRERKKRQTRDALVHAALTQFNAKGYERTAVREITDAVDVSERTFFRYFANKEDLVLSFVGDSTDAFIRELAARPPAEAPLEALTRSFRASFRAFTADDQQPGEESPYLLVIKLIDTTPSLLAALLRYTHDRDDEIVRVLAAREGVDPAADRRPRLAVLAYGALTVAATREWRTGGDDSADAMLAAFDAYAEQLRPALFDRWT